MATPFLNPDLKRRLKAGETLGCHWLSLGAPVLAELAAEGSPDAIVIDMQHGVWDRVTLEAAVGSAGGAPVIARVADQSDYVICSALDAGCTGVIVPMVNTAAQCADVVAAAHYPPKGRRSAGGVRGTFDRAAYRDGAAEHTMVAIMVETAEAVENCEAIAATPGLDMIFIGPTDLSLALGQGAGTPQFEAALTRVRAACKANGIVTGLYTGSLELAISRAAEGFGFVVTTGDIQLNRAARGVFDAFRAGLKS